MSFTNENITDAELRKKRKIVEENPEEQGLVGNGSEEIYSQTRESTEIEKILKSKKSSLANKPFPRQSDCFL